MRVLVACEFSGVVRDAFLDKNHDAWSCDLLPNDSGGNHIQGDVLEVMGNGWDLMIAHPPCTYLAVSGNRWYANSAKRNKAIEFVRKFFDAPIPKWCIENPVSVISTQIRKPDQIIQPWQFGHGETKATCLWLKNIPLLQPTNIVDGRDARIWKMSPSPERGKLRSVTYEGIAKAMASQWG